MKSKLQAKRRKPNLCANDIRGFAALSGQILTRRAAARLASLFNILAVVFTDRRGLTPFTQREVAKAIDYSTATVSKDVRFLEELGFMRRRPDDEDGRRCYILMRPPSWVYWTGLDGLWGPNQ